MENSFFESDPILGRARIINREYRSKVKKSLNSLLHSAEKGLKGNLRSLKEKYQGLDVERRFQTPLYYVHSCLREALREGRVAQVRSNLEQLVQLESSDIYADRLNISSARTEPWEDQLIREIHTSPIRNARGQKPLMKAVGAWELVEAMKAIEAAIGLIEVADGAMGEEIREYLTGIKVFSGEAVQGMTDVRLFGTMFIRLPDPNHEPVSYYVEHIVHETSHTHLHALMAHDLLVTNSLEELYPAPLRIDPRPMFGVFHATFVLSRIVRIFRKLKSFSGEKRFLEPMEFLQKRFENGYATVKKYARCTELGERIVTGLPGTAGITALPGYQPSAA